MVITKHNIFGKQFLALSFAAIMLFSFGMLSNGIYASATYSITKTKSGLVASDPLDNQTETMQQVLSDTRYWNYYGTAVSEKNTAYDIYKDSQGLHIGEPGPDPAQFGDGSYSGYYAVSPDTTALLVHATLTATNQPVLHNDFQNQLEIMTTSGIVNYLDCAAITNTDGTYWTLVHGYGDAVEASHFDTLWVDTSANQPLTRECTVITNGSNYLKLYMDGVMVYSSNKLSLGMPAPFDYYLQTMNSYYNQMRHGVFKDYYATTDEKIQVTNNPSNAAAVSLIDSSGAVLTSSAVTAGSATLDIGKYHFPLAATIQVTDSSGNDIASSPASIYGGDVFTVSSGGTATVPQPPTNLSATTVSSTQINLSWSAPSDNGGSTITGYQIERSPDGSTWSTIVSNTGSTSTTYSDMGLTANTAYTYRVSAINSVGVSSPSNIASATTGSITSGIVLSNVQSMSGTASNKITLANFNAGMGNNRLLVVGISANNNNVASVTFGGVALTNVAASFYNNDAEFWYLKNPSGTGNVVVTTSGPTQAVVGAYSFSGINETTPIPTHAIKHNTSASSPKISITTKYANDWVLDLSSIYGGSTLGSPTCTQQWDVNMPNVITSASSSVIVPTPKSVACGWTANSNDLWDDIAIELNSAR